MALSVSILMVQNGRNDEHLDKKIEVLSRSFQSEFIL